MSVTPIFSDRVMARLDELGRISDVAEHLTRTTYTPAHKQANDLVGGWMREAGLRVHQDGIGNLIGRLPAVDNGAPWLMLGSHLDTVRNAGKYDGMLGVIAAIACVEEIRKQGLSLPFGIELVGFTNEEGTRFGTAMTGSRAIAGCFEPPMLEAKDRDGISYEQAMREFGLDPADIASCKWPADIAGRKLAAFMELHIEQGPVLEANNLALGVVTAISGARRYRVEFKGLAGHAGTVPMGSRRDALLAAAEAALYIERRCTGTPTLVGTVGQMEALPGAVNVIPGLARFSIDIRAGVDAVRDLAADDVLAEVQAIAKRRNVEATVTPLYNSAATPCDPRLMDAVEAAIKAQNVPGMHLPSGAGHDAMTIADLCPVGMIFMRCTRGISHNPLEAVLPQDVELATAALYHFITHFDPAALAA